MSINTEILPMSGIMDRYRRFVVDGRPVATGFFAVADAWACTNPSAGRGLTVGFKHAVRLRDVLHTGDANPYALAEEFHQITETEAAPWFWSQIADDRARIAEIMAVREGRQPAPPADEPARLMRDLRRFAPADPDIARAMLEYIGTLTPIQEIADRLDLRDKLAAVKQSVSDRLRALSRLSSCESDFAASAISPGRSARGCDVGSMGYGPARRRWSRSVTRRRRGERDVYAEVPRGVAEHVAARVSSGLLRALRGLEYCVVEERMDCDQPRVCGS